MSIQRVILDKVTGGIDSSGETYEVSYQVIMDKSDDISLMLDYAESRDSSKGWSLPKRGDRYIIGGVKAGKQYPTLKGEYSSISDSIGAGADENTVSTTIVYLDLNNVAGSRNSYANSISIDKAEDDNFTGNGKDIPYQSNHPYSVWNYVVSYSFSNESAGDSASASASVDWAVDQAYDVSLEPVFYDYFTNMHYDQKKDKSLTTASKLITNTAGDPVYTTRKVFNLMLSFTYYVKKFDINKIKLISSVNRNKIKIAGITIQPYAGKLQKLNVSKTEAKSTSIDDSYYKIQAGIEIGIQKGVYFTEMLSKGLRAKMLRKSDNTIVPLAIQTATIPSEYGEKYATTFKDYAYTENKLKLGSFDQTDHRLDVTEEQPLKADGSLVLGDGTIDPSNTSAIYNATAKFKVYETIPVDWSGFKFPRKGL